MSGKGIDLMDNSKSYGIILQSFLVVMSPFLRNISLFFLRTVGNSVSISQ